MDEIWSAWPEDEDSRRKAEIEEMMRRDRERYFRDEAVQQEYRDILDRWLITDHRREQASAERQLAPRPIDQTLARSNENGDLAIGVTARDGGKVPTSAYHQAIAPAPNNASDEAPAGRMRRIVSTAIEEAGSAFGSQPLGLSREDADALGRFGIFLDQETRGGGPIRLANEALIRPAAVLLDAVARSGKATSVGLATGIGQTAKELGMSSAWANRLSRDVKALADVTGALTPSMYGSKPNPIWHTDVHSHFIAGQRGSSVDRLHSRAQPLHMEMAEIGRDVARETGAKFIEGPMKTIDAANEKMSRKNYSDPSLLTDLARHTFVVETPTQADAVVHNLARHHYSVLDEGWKISARGYLDRKVLVKATDGTVGEIQIMPPSMHKAKMELGGHDLYAQIRNLPSGVEKRGLVQREIALYRAAQQEMGEQWNGVIGE
jgi:hypothetical protein